MDLPFPSFRCLDLMQFPQQFFRCQQCPDLKHSVYKILLFHTAVRQCLQQSRYFRDLYVLMLLQLAQCLRYMPSAVSHIGTYGNIGLMPFPVDCHRHAAKGQWNRRFRFTDLQIQSLYQREMLQYLIGSPLHHRFDQLKGMLLHKLRNKLADLSVIGGKAQIIRHSRRAGVCIQGGIHVKMLSFFIFFRIYAVMRIYFQFFDTDLIFPILISHLLTPPFPIPFQSFLFSTV